jgi:hypothetical protein
MGSEGLNLFQSSKRRFRRLFIYPLANLAAPWLFLSIAPGFDQQPATSIRKPENPPNEILKSERTSPRIAVAIAFFWRLTLSLRQYGLGTFSAYSDLLAFDFEFVKLNRFCSRNHHAKRVNFSRIISFR